MKTLIYFSEIDRKFYSYFLLLFFSGCLFTSYGQIIHQRAHTIRQENPLPGYIEISADKTDAHILVNVIYNAIPDGYHITFTKSFIGTTVAKVEQQMNDAMESLFADAGQLNLSKKDMVADVTALDPIFDFTIQDNVETSAPSGYKVTENIMFNIKSVHTLRQLYKICLQHSIYDILDVQAYCKNSKPVYDSLYDKAVAILNRKKELCTKIGYEFSQGYAKFENRKEVVYPGERYLKSYISNASAYKHHLSQNSTIKQERELDVDDYFTYNLKDADFVFHTDETVPVIQFYYQVDYHYLKKDTEKEKEDKEKQKNELATKGQTLIYIIDKKGNLKKIDVGDEEKTTK